jgi:hypothetical protein
MGCPKNNSQGLDARNERTVQNPDALSQIMEQASCNISATDCRIGSHPSHIPIPAAINAPVHQRMSLSSNMTRETTEGLSQNL